MLRHIAIIMDGNGRWASGRQLNRFKGHQAGGEAADRILKECVRRKIECLTLYALSTENVTSRPKLEVQLLFTLLKNQILNRAYELKKMNIQLQVIGDLSVFPSGLRKLIVNTVNDTQSNTGLKLNLALNYSGRWDILQATRAVAAACQNGSLDANQLSEKALNPYFALADQPDPDLLIRTGGDCRISNFLLWQLAYTELYFTDCYWPDFDETRLDVAIQSFDQRQRRFGQTGAQVEEGSHA